jgi:hypothetical protein
MIRGTYLRRRLDTRNWRPEAADEDGAPGMSIGTANYCGWLLT